MCDTAFCDDTTYLAECTDCGRDNCHCNYDPDYARDQELLWDMETNA